MDQFVLLAWLEEATGIESSSWVLLFTLIVLVSNLVTRVIPDDAKGTLLLLKRITKAIGLYASNRVTSGVTVNEVAKTTIQEIPKVAKSVLDSGKKES